jgi:uncharacterized protein
MVILPRNEKKQTEWIKNKWPGWCDERRIIIPEHVVNGLDLMWHSDFVVSGGGTMNREAAALGVPVYTIFRGKTPTVDRYLSDTGRLTFLETVEDVKTKLKIARRHQATDKTEDTKNTLDVIMKHLIGIVEKG